MEGGVRRYGCLGVGGGRYGATYGDVAVQARWWVSVEARVGWCSFDLIGVNGGACLVAGGAGMNGVRCGRELVGLGLA